MLSDIFLFIGTGVAILGTICAFIAFGMDKWESLILKPVVVSMTAAMFATIILIMIGADGNFVEKIKYLFSKTAIASPLAFGMFVMTFWIVFNLATKAIRKFRSRSSAD